MNRSDWRILQALSAGSSLVVALHGLTNGKWPQAHTICTLLGIAGAIEP